MTIHTITNTRHGVPYGDSEVSITYVATFDLEEATGVIGAASVRIETIHHESGGKSFPMSPTLQNYWLGLLEDGYDPIRAAAGRLVP